MYPTPQHLNAEYQVTTKYLEQTNFNEKVFLLLATNTAMMVIPSYISNSWQFSSVFFWFGRITNTNDLTAQHVGGTEIETAREGELHHTALRIRAQGLAEPGSLGFLTVVQNLE